MPAESGSDTEVAATKGVAVERGAGGLSKRKKVLFAAATTVILLGLCELVCRGLGLGGPPMLHHVPHWQSTEEGLT
jgi:hypothetical protein